MPAKYGQKYGTNIITSILGSWNFAWTVYVKYRFGIQVLSGFVQKPRGFFFGIPEVPHGQHVASCLALGSQREAGDENNHVPSGNLLQFANLKMADL